MKLFKKGAALILGLGLMAGTGTMAAHAANALQNIKSRGTIKIGMLVDFPPYGLMNEQNKPDGYDADVAKLLAKDMGVELQLVPVTGPNRIPYLLSGQVDLLVASLAITPARAKKVEFSKPYSAISVWLFGEKGVQVDGAKELSGKTIGVPRASTQDAAITKIAPKDAHIRRFDSDASNVQALLSGQVQLIGCSNSVIGQVNKVVPGKFEKKFALYEQVEGIAVKPGEPKLLARVNQFIDKIKSNGELNKINEKWINEPMPDAIKKDASK